jgi:cell division protein YceG involved in septum cleavage
MSFELSGKRGHRADCVDAFVAMLCAKLPAGVALHEQDERFSTAEAQAGARGADRRVKEVVTKATLPEGKNMLEFFAVLDAAKIAKAGELEALARDRDFLGRHDITGDTVEGYLFPDTYEFRVNEKPAVVLQRRITRHQERWPSCSPAPA